MALTIRVRPKFPAKVLGSDGISIAKIGGTYTFSLDADLTAVAAVSGTGIVRRLSASSWTAGTAVSLAEMAQRSASTLLGNPTGGAAGLAEITLVAPLAFVGTTLTFSTNGVTDAMLRQSAGLSIIGRAANSTGNVADITGTAGAAFVVNNSGTSLMFTRTPVLGAAGVGTGALSLAGTTSGSVTITPQAAAGTYNFNLPTAAGSAGQPLLSGGGGAAAQTYGPLATVNLGPGAVVQEVNAVYTTYSAHTTTIPLDDTIPQNSEGEQIITATITPKSASNRIVVRFSGVGRSSANVTIAALFRDSVANALFAKVTDTAAWYANLDFTFEDSPATTSAVTYKIRIGPSAAASVFLNGSSSARLFGGASAVTLNLFEVAG